MHLAPPTSGVSCGSGVGGEVDGSGGDEKKKRMGGGGYSTVVVVGGEWNFTSLPFTALLSCSCLIVEL
jgi:hypothetical protein